LPKIEGWALRQQQDRVNRYPCSSRGRHTVPQQGV